MTSYSNNRFNKCFFFLNLECDDGTYGYSCVNNCSGHCLNGSSCNKHTGVCDRGCNPGYVSDDCSKGKLYLSIFVITIIMLNKLLY